MKFISSKYRSSRSDRGASSVEAAIVLPIFLVLVLAVFDYANIMYQQSLLTDSMRRVSRLVSVDGEIPSPFSRSRWNDWRVSKVESPFFSSLPAGLTGTIVSLEATSVVLSDNNGIPYGCGMKLTLEADLTCISCHLVAPAVAEDEGSSHRGFTFHYSTVVPSESPSSC